MIALIHIKKTAGKTVKHLLRCEYGARHCDIKRWHPDDRCLDADGLRRVRTVMPQCRSIAGHSVRAYSDLQHEAPNLAFYTFLRDPIRRCISQYQYDVSLGRTAPNTFDQWIGRDNVSNLQVKSLAGDDNLDRAIEIADQDLAFVGLTEAFEESLAMMPRLLGTPPIRPQRARINAAADNRIRDQLLADNDALARIRAVNQLDVALYDYVQRHLFPRSRRQCTRTTRSCATRQGTVNKGFVANVGYRYGVYKPAITAWRLGQRLCG